MPKDSIGEGFRNRRKELRITQPQLAELAQVSVNTVNKLERGTGNTTLEILNKLGDILGLELTLIPKSKVVKP
jgi:transcriptional regulator with XRE-family HTH domain